ncbi:ATP-dependent DNA helicase RecQ [Nymphon striatum]|nr:ATP-dependent DNA helicase RecQ [Nymphon striatum]
MTRKLADIFGFDEFRIGQREIVDAVCAGKNTLAIMPTGGGKSLCFQLPALARDGLTVVISPLIALMRDQVRSLRSAGVAAGALTSGNTDEETDQVFDALHNGTLKLLYIAPERLASSGTRDMLARANCSMIAVDEAHCVSQWASRDLYAGVRPSQFEPVVRSKRRSRAARSLTSQTPVKVNPASFTCGTRAKTETLSQALREAGHSACYYHGGMDADDRREVERRFSQEDGLVVVATVAFGMGVDKPDIRWVAHADLPKSVESYYQEIGRAGRDGTPADTLTLYGLAPDDRKAADHARLNALLGLAEALECRRKPLLEYFGDTNITCGNCDLCEKPPETFDGTQAVRKALSAILRTGEYFGAGHLIDILLGNSTDKVKARGHDQLPTFGIGGEYDKRGWQAVFRQMMGRDLIRPDPSRHGAFRMTQDARPILRDEATITLRKDTIRKGARPAIKTLVSDEDAPLLSALKAKRRAFAEAARAPAYVIFNDKTLIEMAETRPANLDEFARISGVGAKKLESFGAAFLEVINGAPTPELHPSRRKLAGRDSGALFDQLLEVQANLSHGPDGYDKPLSCSASLIAKVAEVKPSDANSMNRLLGERRGERFGEAFLNVLKAGFGARGYITSQRRPPMLTVISPAKKLDMTAVDVTPTLPEFQADANTLAGVARDLSVNDLRKLMHISENLASLNRDRFQSFEDVSTPENAKAAMYIFAGDTYTGLEAKSLDADEVAFAQDHLRILSGLYGLLKPLDAIQAYRLEMGSRLKTTRGKSLYDFWGSTISEEYFGAVKLDALSLNVITPQFYEDKPGGPKIVSFFAKQARGAMARFIIQNRLTKPEQIRDFDTGGYTYQAKESTPDRPVFLRTEAAFEALKKAS